MGFILSTIALGFFILVYIIEGIVSLFIDVKHTKWFKTTSKRKFNKAFKVDVFGNWLFKDFWNITLSKGGYEFGVFGETLSSVFGKKRREGSLNILGYGISIIIDIIDFTKWKKGGHCKASIMTEEKINNFLNI